jgi:multiple sugar transport system ATP-binding protein
MEFLELKNITKIYQKDILAIDNINLKIHDGEFLVLLGPSGCGKTTTMRMIAGLEEVTEGEILLEGKLMNHLQPKDRGVSMIFQSYAVWPHMTVFENIAYALKLRKMKKDDIKRKVLEVAAKANISEYINRYPTQLSGGQRQRVAVARAMAVEPKLFLMDEPLSNLDAKLRVSMRTDLKEVHNELGATSIFVTHDQAEAMSLADRIVVMNTGTIEQIGTPNEIYHDSKTIFVANFIGSPSTNFIDAEIVKVDNNYFAKTEAFELLLDSKFNENISKYVGETVVLGIRPENFIVVDKKEELFNLDVIIIEPQGSHSIVVGRLLGKQIKIVTSKILDLKSNKTLPIKIAGDYFIFDKKTEKRIY